MQDKSVAAHQRPVDEKIPVSAGRIYSLQVGLTGGLLGGSAMALLGMIQSALSGHSIFYPANLTAAVLLPELQAASPSQLAEFRADALLVGLLVHFAISAGLGVLFTLLLPAVPGSPLLWGAVISPVLWIIGFSTLQILNPVMYRNVEPVGFALGHILFGLILGWWVMQREGGGHA